MNPRTVLILDDEPDVRTVAALALARVAGWEVVMASCPDEAMRHLRHTAADLVLLDPCSASGERLRALMRGEDPTQDGLELPLILLTGRLHPADIDRYSELGALGIIAKPFNPMTLAARVDAMLTHAA